MARESKEAAGWGFRLVAIVITLVVVAGVFAYAFSINTEIASMVHAAIPFIAAVIVSRVLGAIGKLSHKRWQIYVTVLLLAAVIVCLKIAGLF